MTPLQAAIITQFDEPNNSSKQKALSAELVANTLQISEEDAKKELGFWVSHGVLKESQLQRIQSIGREIQTETVYLASKTLDRNNDREFGGIEDSRLDYIRNQ